MIGDEGFLKKVQAAIEGEPRIRSRSSPLHVEVKDNRLVIDGDVDSVAAKRLAVHLAAQADGLDTVEDQLCVVPAEERSDGEILDSYTQLILGQIDLKNCAISRTAKGETESLHQTQDDDRSGEFTFSVTDGVITLDGFVISLSHKRIAEVLAWWVPGCRNVINRLAVIPAEMDSDDEVSDAIRLALEMDPLLAHADQINLSTNSGIVTMQGVIATEEERQMAEFDAWCVLGVNDVNNRLEVRK